MIDKKLLISQLIKADIRKGDLLFLTINIGSIGYFNKSRSQTYKDLLDIFIDQVDEAQGGIILASYTDGVPLWKFSTNSFNSDSKTNSGGFSNYLINQKKSFRSEHPYDSCVGYGKRAKKALKNINLNSKAYEIFDYFQEGRAFYLMIGTVFDKKNAPPSLHYSQDKLGFTSYFPLKYLEKIYFKNDAKIIMRKYSGGCSKGGYKLSRDLIANEYAKEFKFGQASSLMINPIESTKYTTLELLKNRKKYNCDNNLCLSCKGNYYYDPLNFIKIVILYIYANFKNRFKISS